MTARLTELTLPEGVAFEPNDRVTISMVHPWYLRWLPAAKVTLWVTTDGRLHVGSEDVAA